MANIEEQRDKIVQALVQALAEVPDERILLVKDPALLGQQMARRVTEHPF